MDDKADQRPASSAVMTAVAESLALDGFAWVSAEEMGGTTGAAGDWLTGRALPIAGTIWALTCSWLMAAATVGGVSGPSPCGKASRGAKPTSRTIRAATTTPSMAGSRAGFDPVTDAIGAHPATIAILRSCDVLFTGLTRADLRPETWHVEMHQFRIEARPDIEGQPTPEGLHRDGVDWVLVLLVRRENVASGETNITDLQRALVSSFTLTDPMDAALVDDGRVYHGVTRYGHWTLRGPPSATCS